MPYYVYVILCTDGSFYTGYTKNVDKRMRLHESGKGARYTRIHKPRKIVYIEPFDTQTQAMKREKQMKKLTHRQKLNLVKSQSSLK